MLPYHHISFTQDWTRLTASVALLLTLTGTLPNFACGAQDASHRTSNGIVSLFTRVRAHKRAAVICIGDSLTAGAHSKSKNDPTSFVPYADIMQLELDKGVHILPLGFCGYTTKRLLETRDLTENAPEAEWLIGLLLVSCRSCL